MEVVQDEEGLSLGVKDLRLDGVGNEVTKMK